jgi:hypothetical protein
MNLICPTTFIFKFLVLILLFKTLKASEEISIKSAILIKGFSVPKSKAKMLSNGQYSPSTVSQATEVVREHLEMNFDSRYEACPYNDPILLSGFEVLRFEMDVEIERIKPAIIDSLLKRYVRLAVKHNALPFSIDDPNNPDHDEIRNDVRKIVIFAQECQLHDISVPGHQALILLEAVYRFGAPSVRYGLAFQKLYLSLSTDGFSSFYVFIIKHFLPARGALPVLYINIAAASSSIRRDFIFFITCLYARVKAINRELDLEAFNRHSAMLFACLISCNLLEEFNHMILDILPLLDMVKLSISPRIVKSVTELLAEFKDSPNAMVELFCEKIFTDQVLLGMDESHFVCLGELFTSIQDNQSDLFERFLPSLSNEAVAKLFSLQDYYSIFTRQFASLETMDSFFDSFTSMNQSELLEFSEIIISHASNLSKYIKFQSDVAYSFLTKLFKVIPDLVERSIAEKSDDLDGFRYSVFVGLLELVFLSPINRKHVTEIFSKVLFFFNLRVKGYANFDLILAETNARVLDLVEESITTYRFFTSFKELKVFYMYVKFVSEENADLVMNSCFMNYLCSSKTLLVDFFDMLENITRLKIDCSAMFSNFVTYQLNKFISVSGTVTIENYLDGMFISIIRLIIVNDLLNKSEKEFTKYIVNALAKKQVLN